MAKGIPGARARELSVQNNTVVPPGAKCIPDSDTPIPDGVSIRSGKGVQIEFMYQGIRCTETLRGAPTIAQVLKVSQLRQRVVQAIGLNLFDYAQEFPNSPRVQAKQRTENKRTIATIGEALDEWLDSVKNTVGENAFIDYSKDIKGQLKTAPLYALESESVPESRRRPGRLEDLTVDQLTDVGINNLRSWFLERPVSVKRVMNLLTPLRGTMARLAVSRVIETNPFERVRPLKRKKVRIERQPDSNYGNGKPPRSIDEVARFREDDDRPDPFSPDEIAAFLPEMAKPFMHLVEFWLWTGLRTGELIALEWTDIDLQGGEVCIRNSLSRGVYKETKSDRIRWVKLLEPARKALEAQFAYSGQVGTLVFPNPYTNRRWANESKICSRFKQALGRAGVRYRRPYHCRHTYVSTLLSAGESTLFVAEQLGHRDWSMVLKHYGRWIPTVYTQAGQRVAHLHRSQWKALADVVAPAKS